MRFKPSVSIFPLFPSAIVFEVSSVFQAFYRSIDVIAQGNLHNHNAVFTNYESSDETQSFKRFETDFCVRYSVFQVPGEGSYPVV